MGQKSSKRQSSDARQLGCVFQDMTPPKSILQKCTDMRKPIRRVKFTKAIARHTKIRDQNPSLGYICPSEPHQRSPNAPKFEDRSPEETEWQEQGAREAAWKLADSMECYTFLRNVTDLLSDFKTPSERCFGQPFKGPIIPFGSLVEYHPITAKDQSKNPSIWQEVLPGSFLGYALYAG